MIFKLERIGPAFIGRGGFIDANDRHVEALVVVEHADGRRGIFLEALPDGDAYVLFRKTYTIEVVKWKQICMVPEPDYKGMG